MDIEDIKKLVGLMVENDLSRVEIKTGESHVLLRRGQPQINSPIQVTHQPLAAPQSLPAPAATPAATSSASPAANETIIRSPMVGTFYASPDPDSPAFIKPGDTVGPASVVCLIEAMKVFNEIKAECSGRVTRVLVENRQAVEFDQPLFAVAAG